MNILSKSVFALLLFASKCSAFGSIAPSQEVLQFEGIAPQGLGSAFLTGTFTEGNFEVFTPNGQWVDSAHPDLGIEHPSNGTDWFLNNNTGGIIISRIDSSPFFLQSFEATEYTYVLPGNHAIFVDATRTDGTQISAAFMTDARPAYIVPEFQLFTLPGDWLQMPLSSVTITAPNNGFAIDDIRLLPVPEPKGVVMGCLSCMGAAAISSRRLRRPQV